MSFRADLFTFVINRLLHGSVSAELSRELHERVVASKDTGATSELIVKINIKPQRSGLCYITVTHSGKIPREPAEPTPMWITDDGNLADHDPRQQHLPLREAEQPTTPQEVANGDN